MVRGKFRAIRQKIWISHTQDMHNIYNEHNIQKLIKMPNIFQYFALKDEM